MECKDCFLWLRHKDGKNRPLEKGSCYNRGFVGRIFRSFTITTSNTRCSKGVLAKSEIEKLLGK